MTQGSSARDAITLRLSDRLLFERCRAGDAGARAALVERHMPFARRLAYRYRGGREPLEDLVQVAFVGLLKAIDRYQPDRASSFASFAMPTILGELKRHFRDRGWSVRLPRALQELALSVERVADELSRTTGRTPTANEIAAYIGVSAEQVLEAREAADAQRALPLEQTVGDESDGSMLADVIGADDPGYGRAEDGATLRRLLRTLDERDRRILLLRFAGECTQSEIGARVGVSQMHVSRLIDRALKTLRMRAYALPEPTASHPQPASSPRAARRHSPEPAGRPPQRRPAVVGA